jgi:hypothetical protein
LAELHGWEQSIDMTAACRCRERHLKPEQGLERHAIERRPATSRESVILIIMALPCPLLENPQPMTWQLRAAKSSECAADG